MQLAAAEYHELVGIDGRLDAQRHVVDGLALQTLANLPAGDELAFAAQEGRGIDLEGHADGRLIDGQAGQRLDGGRIAQGVGNLRFGDAGESHDVAGAGRLHLDPRQAVESQDLRDFLGALLALAGHHGDRHAALDGAALDASDADRTDITRIIQQRDLQLQRAVHVHIRRRAMLDNGLEQRLHVAFAHRRIESGETAQRGGVDHGKIQLLVGRTQAIEQIEGLIQHPAWSGFVAIDLVDDDDGPQAVLEGLLRHEAGLRHRAVHRVNKQQHAIDHGQHALDFAAEVRVTRRVDDVDAIVAPGDRRVLGEDRDAALALQIIRIHDALLQVLARVERPGLTQQLIDERGLAMIDVRDDGDVAKFLSHDGVLRETHHYRALWTKALDNFILSAIMGMEKVLTSVTSSCLSDTDTPTSRTPSAVGVTFTVCRYTLPGFGGGNIELICARGDGQIIAAADLNGRGARIHLRNQRQVDFQRLAHLGPLRQIELERNGRLRFALHRGFHHAHRLFSDGGAPLLRHRSTGFHLRSGRGFGS